MWSSEKNKWTGRTLIKYLGVDERQEGHWRKTKHLFTGKGKNLFEFQESISWKFYAKNTQILASASFGCF